MATYVIKNKEGLYMQIFEINSLKDKDAGEIYWTSNIQEASQVGFNFITFFKKVNADAFKDLEAVEITENIVVQEIKG